MKLIKIQQHVSVRLVLAVALLVAVFAARPAQAATAIRYVKEDAGGANNGSSWTNAYMDLQSALSAATSGNEIWVAGGTYKPGTDRTSTFALKDGIAIYGGFTGAETLRSQRDPAAHLTVLSGDVNGNDNNNISPTEPTRAENVYHVVSSGGNGNTTVLDGFTITGGNANLNAGEHTARGGGIWNYGNTTLSNLVVVHNTALELGGGIYIENSSPSLSNITLEKNTSAEGGGGLANNQALPVLTMVRIMNKHADYTGGGVVNVTGSNATFVEVTISGNTSPSFGGGMSNYGSSPQISKSTFDGNQVTDIADTGQGGALYNNSSDPVLENVTFVNNTAEAGGSSAANLTSSPVFRHVTFTGNWDAILNTGSHPVLQNSIIWGNVYPGTGNAYTIHDDATSQTTVTDSVVQNGYVGGTYVITKDPLLGSLGDYGGSTMTVPLLAGSSAIDEANAVHCPATDQRGVGRPDGIHCDMGAYEFVPTAPVTWTVTKLVDTNDGLCNTDCSLREAILSSHSGDTIQFAVSGSIVPGSPLPVIDKTLVIDGSGHAVKIDGAGSRRIFKVSEPGNLTVKNLTLQNGKAPSPCEWDSGLDSCGGAIYSDGSLIVINSTFSVNTAYLGGAISVWNGSADIENSTFKGNTVEHTGGAIFNLLGAVKTVNNTFYGNTADIGGAIFNDLGNLSLTNNTFSNHTAALGGAVYNSAGSMALINNILANSTGGDDCYNESPNGKIIVNLNNLIETSAVAPYSCGTPVSKLDPKLGSPANNGGPTQTMALLPVSPTINAGNNSDCPTTDQRGIARPQGSQCDIGAYELQPTFADVPMDFWAWQYIERVDAAGITGGCTTSPLNYCPGNTVTRAQMAIFLLRAEHGSDYIPPAATGMFSDVPVTDFAAPFIEQLANEKITGGCATGKYCPTNPVTRAQMAIFLLRAEHGSTYAPPAAVGMFSDVPKTEFTAPFIEQLANEKITGGCGGTKYCPANPVTRDQMAVFLVRTFKLP